MSSNKEENKFKKILISENTGKHFYPSQIEQRTTFKKMESKQYSQESQDLPGTAPGIT